MCDVINAMSAVALGGTDNDCNGYVDQNGVDGDGTAVVDDNEEFRGRQYFLELWLPDGPEPTATTGAMYVETRDAPPEP